VASLSPRSIRVLRLSAGVAFCVAAFALWPQGGGNVMRSDDPTALLQHEQSASYFWDMSKLLRPAGYVAAFCSKSKDGCQTARFPGSNCESEYRWPKVVAGLELVPERQATGEIVRGNDLGYFIMNSAFWDTDVKTISLGFSVEDHNFVRPYYDQVLGSGSKWWSRAAVRTSLERFMDGRKELQVPTDVNLWTTKLMHEVHLGITLSDEDAAEFNDLQQAAIKLIIMPSWKVLGSLAQLGLGAGGLREKRELWLSRYKAAIDGDARGIFPRHLTDRHKLLLATAFMDSLLFAGGLSVPGLISVGLGVVYSDNSPLPVQLRELPSTSVATKLVWEVIRQMPAVVGFPWWSPSGDERTVMNIQMALRDPEVWGTDSDTFRLRNDSDYERYGPVAWAQPANGNGWRSGVLTPGSRGCPGQEFSFAVATEFFYFWREVRSSWSVQETQGWFFKHDGPSAIAFSRHVPWISSFTLERA